jgi:hypothetical protein
VTVNFLIRYQRTILTQKIKLLSETLIYNIILLFNTLPQLKVF